MKILHIATDSKFIDHAFPVFENVYPGANDVVVFAEKTPLKYVKLESDNIEVKRSSFFNKKAKLDKSTYSKYDLVIFHSLPSSTYSEFENIPDSIPTIWLGWGFDYYSGFLRKMPLLLERTQRLYGQLAGATLKLRAFALAKEMVRLVWLRNRRVRVIEKITVFSPVLPKEYDMVKNSRKWKYFPQFASWNYGTIEDNLIKGFEGEVVTGNAILVGNSATYTGNHLEALELLHTLGVKGRQVVAPLSYGDPLLAQELTSLGQALFSDHFEPLMDYMPVQDYVAIIRKCGYVIMNHVRQQAVGNIVIMLYLGARVFVREENPVYDFFKNSGVVLSTVQELEGQSELLNLPLTAEEQANNRAIVSDYWGRERAYERTRKLVEAAFAAKGFKGPAMLAAEYE
jgi:hypothetical protein